MRLSLIAAAWAAACFLHSPVAAALGMIENPSNGGVESGIGAITGWHCTSVDIELRIDGHSIGYAGAGTPRADTAGTCGRSDTGFSLLYNFALLRGGSHRLEAFADGQLFASATFDVGYLGGEFLTGKSASHQIPDFPSIGQKARVAWVQGKQNFVISSVEPMASGSIVGSYSIRYVSLVVSTGDVASTLEPNASVSGTMVFRSDGTYTSNMNVTMGGQVNGGGGNGTYADHGHYMIENGGYDMIVERGETLTLQALTRSGALWASTVISMTRVPSEGKALEASSPTESITTPRRSIGEMVTAALLPAAPGPE